jgi:hypothetical protein
VKVSSDAARLSQCTGSAFTVPIAGNKDAAYVLCSTNNISEALTVKDLTEALAGVAAFPFKVKPMAKCDVPVDTLRDLINRESMEVLSDLQTTPSQDKALYEEGAQLSGAPDSSLPAEAAN